MQILAGLGRPVAQDPLDLTHGVHLHHLAAPGPAQVGFKSRFQANAADAIADLIALLRQGFVFLLGDRLGVAQGMGSQRAVRIAAQHIQIHLSPDQAVALLAEAQHLLGGELASELDAKALGARPLAPLLIQLGFRQTHQLTEPCPQGRPALVVHQLRLEVEAVSEPARDQHLTMAIQDPAAHRVASQQANAVFIGAGPVLLPVQKLQPAQPAHHRRSEQHHQPQQDGRLLLHARVPVSA